jgi:uncharacterized protein (DUF433 family)
MNTRTLSEAEKMARVPGIVYVDGAVGRRAAIDGGMDVFELIEAWLSANRDVDWLLEAYPWMTREMIQAGLDFYALFPEEIDARLQREWEIDRMVEEAGGMTPELLKRIVQSRGH